MSGREGVQRHCFQLIDGRGVLNHEGLRNFTTATNMSNRGIDYAVVIAIMGPQGSGKSTFLDHLAGTNFQEMDALRGRNKTTQGIWMSNCVTTIQRPFTIAMDIEGTGGRERCEVFEIKRALFAVGMAGILFINLGCHDILRQQASCISLLQTVLQIRIKKDVDKSRKINLCFILHDITTTPVERLEEDIMETMKNMWTRIARDGFAGTNINDFFQVQVFGLPNYETQRKEFEDKVAEIRKRTLRVHREGVVPGRAFQENADQLWKRINDPILNLPAHSDMIAEHMCRYFASMGLKPLSSNKDLMELKKEAEAGLMLHSVMGKRASSIRTDSISTLEKKYKYAVAGYITTSLDQLQNLTGDTYWASVREIVRMSTSRDKAGPISNLSCDVAIYSEDITLSDTMIQKLKTYARKVVLSKLKGEADGKIVERLMYRFCSVMWTESPSYSFTAELAAGQASAEAMKLLSVMAVAQIDGISSTRTHISELLLSYLLDKEPFNEKSFNEESSNWKSSNEKSSNERSSNEKPSNEESSNEQPSKEKSFMIWSLDMEGDRYEVVGYRCNLDDGDSYKGVGYRCDSEYGDRYEGDTLKIQVSEDDTILEPWRCKSLKSQFNHASNAILKNVYSNLDKLGREKRKKSGKWISRQVWRGVGFLPTRVTGILGAISLGYFSSVAERVRLFFDRRVQNLKQAEEEARQRVIELQQIHLQYLQKCLQKSRKKICKGL